MHMPTVRDQLERNRMIRTIVQGYFFALSKENHNLVGFFHYIVICRAVNED